MKAKLIQGTVFESEYLENKLNTFMSSVSHVYSVSQSMSDTGAILLYTVLYDD